MNRFRTCLAKLEKIPGALFLPEKTLLPYLRLFFGCTGARFIFHVTEIIFKVDMNKADFAWPVAWMRGLSGGWLVQMPFWMVGFNVLFFTSAAGFPKWRVFRIGAALSLFFLMALLDSFGKNHNAESGWIFAAALLCWCKDDETPFWKEMNAKLIWAACATFLVGYFLAGAYKLEGFLRLWGRGESAYSIAATYLPMNFQFARFWMDPIAPLPLFLGHPGIVTAVLFCALLAFEVGSIAPIFYPRLIRPWFFTVMGLHIGALIFMNTNFFGSAMLAVILLLCHPLEWKKQATP